MISKGAINAKSKKNYSFQKTYIEFANRRNSTLTHRHQAKVLNDHLQTFNTLCIDADKLKEEEEWVAISTALRNENTVHGIQIISDVGGLQENKQIHPELIRQRSRVLAAKEKQKLNRVPAILIHSRISNSLVGSIKSCLVSNRVITRLELCGFPLSIKAIQLLEKGLFGNNSLTKLSLARSAIGDAGLEG